MNGMPDVAGAGEAENLSERQRRILAMIGQWVEKHGYPPTFREIGQAVGLVSPSSVAHQVKVLERKGFLRHDAERPRALALAPPDQDTSSAFPRPAPAWVPIVGAIAAGIPITAVETAEEYLPLPPDLVGRGTVFGLRVKGDSMIEAAICDGDIVLIRQQDTADNGDIVAALLDGEATVKVYRRGVKTVVLEPRNSAYQPIESAHVIILGKVVSVFRRL